MARSGALPRASKGFRSDEAKSPLTTGFVTWSDIGLRKWGK